MKRVTYISNFTHALNEAELQEIGEVSVRNNRQDGLTGVLLAFQGIFFQILEGDDHKVDATYERIRNDARHTHIFLVNMEQNIQERLYPDWEMKLVVLDERNDDLVRSVRSLLGAVTHTHRILEKYAPLTVLHRIQEGINPLNLSFRFVERTVLFSDIMASTTLTEHLGPGEMSSLLDEYYGAALRAIRQRGGIISKLTGDGLMAYWDARQSDDALRAGVEILDQLVKIREQAGPTDPGRLLYAGVGLASGRVMEGNIGSSIKKDYTLLGDTVNKASRLEGVTRRVPYGLIFDATVKPYLEYAWDIKKVGRFQPKGKTQTVDLFTLNDRSIVLDLPKGGLKQAILRGELGAA